jgi:hypothetical protein
MFRLYVAYMLVHLLPVCYDLITALYLVSPFHKGACARHFVWPLEGEALAQQALAVAHRPQRHLLRLRLVAVLHKRLQASFSSYFSVHVGPLLPANLRVPQDVVNACTTMHNTLHVMEAHCMKRCFQPDLFDWWLWHALTRMGEQTRRAVRCPSAPYERHIVYGSSPSGSIHIHNYVEAMMRCAHHNAASFSSWLCG